MIKKALIYISISVMAVFLVACGATSKMDKSSKNEKNHTESKQKKKEEKQTNYQKITGENVTYYVMNPDPVFGSTAVLIEKDGKGLLVDTQFSKDDADKTIQLIKSKKIDLETIYVSYSDPDYYFGTAFIQEAFPTAKVVATEGTIDRIKSTYENKLTVWADTLKDKAPKEVIIPEAIDNKVALGNEEFQITGTDKPVLYNATDQLILGGIPVSTDGHLFMADTKTVESQENWINDLTGLEELQAKTVIPGHFGQGNKFTADNITFTKDYIQKFIEVEQSSQTSAEIMQKMKAAYPDLAESSLEMSAKVVTGEQAWD